MKYPSDTNLYDYICIGHFHIIGSSNGEQQWNTFYSEDVLFIFLENKKKSHASLKFLNIVMSNYKSILCGIKATFPPAADLLRERSHIT